MMDWCQAHLPEKMLPFIDLSTLSMVSNEFINWPNKLHSDVVYSCQMYHQPGYLYLSAEHQQLLSRAKLGYFLLYPPENVFTEKELEVIFCVLQNMSSKLIALHLGLSHRTVENKLQVIYRKAGAHSLSQFSEYCRYKGYDHYIPQKFLSPTSQLLDMSL